jgi:hypothetical protein
MGQIAPDINAETNASKTGWLQNAEGLMNTAANIGTAGAKGAFGSGLQNLMGQ